MQRISKRRAAIAAALALVATSGTAAQASTVPDTNVVQADLQRIVKHATEDSTQTALHAAALADQVAGPLRELVAASMRRTSRDASALVRDVYSQAGFTAFAVINRAGRIVGGYNVLSVGTPATGRWYFGWSTSTDGCATVAMTNSVTPSILRVKRVSPTSIRVMDRTTGASVRRSGFGVAVIC